MSDTRPADAVDVGGGNWIEGGEPTPPASGAFTLTCVSCGQSIAFDAHPADWDSHPGTPGELRVLIECPHCGVQQYTDGMTEVEYVAAQSAVIEREVRAEVARRLGIASEQVALVSSADSGSGGDAAATG